MGSGLFLWPTNLIGYLKRIAGFGSKRASLKNPNDPLWRTLFGAARTNSGVTVTQERALQVSAVFACVRVLSETIASLPLKLYKRVDGGKEPATKHHMYSLLHDSPNEHLTSYEFRETMIAHLNLRGNFYAIRQFNNAGRIAGLIILNPANMKVKLEEGEIVYEYTWENGDIQFFSAEEIWHVRGLSTDGLIGLSPITVAREAIGLSIATEEHGARLFGNDAKPGGLLVHPGNLSEEASERLKDSWERAHAGVDNAWKVAVLEGGLTWQSVGFTNDDAQFLETRNFQVQDIARIYRVPAVMIGHADKTQTFASAEQFFLNFAVHTITPWLKRIEQSINMNLLSKKERRTYFAEFNMDGLLRGDIASRYSAYAIARQNKWMSANEVREKENMNHIPDGDVYENPNITVGDNDEQGNEDI
ncbi:MAG: phage portal protein [Candidatus Omnitrophica bacterium]|nr:phage portal protein [Candidatus Omnitrophota bacterium]